MKQGFRGNCGFKGKLGMCPSLAEPVSGGFPRSNFEMFHMKHCIKIAWLQATSRRQIKSFSVQQFFKNAAEVWASSPRLRSKLYLQQVFPAAIAFFETVPFTIWLLLWSKLQIQTRQRGNCSTLAGKSRGGTPFCRTWKTVFPKRSVFNHKPQATKKFFGAAVFQKCWRGVGE